MKRSCPPPDKTRMSTNSPNQSRHPLPLPRISKLVYAMQEQFFKHSTLHSSRLIVTLYHESRASGNLILEYFKNPSPAVQFKPVLLTHPVTPVVDTVLVHVQRERERGVAAHVGGPAKRNTVPRSYSVLNDRPLFRDQLRISGRF
ncbi:hypothetical protein MIMGU_mgv1a015837mg [Erythranthe guttata]|uniref:Uncharacterized protein n=1 Tax=Erythranthe guttata TaxID=4155 RepID=A0A022PS59_ERYGU|nr:hypothetical protein MIMGU_mgv1a015837mg [Erythranthe guttata]